MSETDPGEESGLPANIALASRSPSRSVALDHGLVILAMNLPYWHVQEAGHHVLYVESDRLPRVTAELEAFDAEQAEWSPAESDHSIPDHPPSFYVPYAATLLLIASFILQEAYAPAYTQAGRMDAIGLFTRGEWWRPLTSLCLHADPLHLLGNLIFGLWYGQMVNRAFGTALGWALILLSGVLGNTLVGALHYPEPHLAIGASTAVFGALGLLVAEGLTHRWQQRFTSRLGPLMIPLVAGGMLLAWTGGFDDPKIDAAAHALGFGSGILLGLLTALAQTLRERNRT